MVINIILILTSVVALASILNLFDKKELKNKSISMEVELPGNLPIISFYGKKGRVLNFIIDSGSNISHICTEYINDTDNEFIGEYSESEVTGLGAVNKGIIMCKATLHDVFNHTFEVELSVSEQLIDVAKSIKECTGVTIHGLLGTDFLQKYNCALDFKELKIYHNK